ncbi:replication factor A, putative [Entamoeba histolytica HM-1:IMSS-B]|uniref:Replication factor A, putative n=6 Tax=Entamoeba histolytica TaxID=5759 RepID=C4LTY9_ENTH1|nr:replication factor A, putative [Entamoeba histolytica HM-1:IMSS]EMD46905.1 replication factor A, putative [Entamoeba histolytica KU27]EMH76534.1 replication factor A, putative [Entamoeba histolytica HM-1:IMSS-B]EMS14281.1 replication factor A, putative [Entamoeba histolytica HM-3:IMSS]ENY63641.1 replication factor A, putative [Entamoeba histolytica HM-1:IMSS-A]GAT92051.1 replication factor a putative [Entamoeba histolytica]|eukprot:XP_656777.1 replication factor A, putative [Entamoeba histolytica HM-1:IMSS]
MSITGGCIEDIIKTGSNCGDVNVQIKEIKSEVEIIISDGEYFSRAKFPKNNQAHQYQKVCIRSCVYIAEKKYIDVKDFECEEIFDELIGSPIDVNQYLGIENSHLPISQNSQNTLPTAQRHSITNELEKEEDDDDKQQINEDESILFNLLKEQDSMKCCIKGYVVHKSRINEFGNEEGKIFSVILQDSEGSEFKVSFFNAMVDKFYSSIIEEQTIVMNKIRIKKMNETSEKIKTRMMNNLEGIVTSATSIALAKIPIPSLITTIDSIHDIINTNYLSSDFYFIGCVLEKGDVNNITLNNTNKDKTDIIIGDESEYSINIQIFSNTLVSLVNEKININSIVLITKCKVIKTKNGDNYFGELKKGSQITIINKYSDIPNYVQLLYSQQRYESLLNIKKDSAHILFNELSKKLRKSNEVIGIKGLKEYCDEVKMRNNNHPATFIIKARIKIIKTNDLTYYGCETCRSKKEEGYSYCNKCNRKRNGKLYYKVNVLLENNEEEESFEQWAIIFDECARKLFNMSADEMNVLDEDDVKKEMNKFIGKEFILKVKGKINPMKHDEVFTVIDEMKIF